MTCLRFSESQIISSFTSCRFHIHFLCISGASFMQLSDLAWQIQVLVSADVFKEIILQRLVGAKGNFLVKNRKSIPLELKQTLVIIFHHTCFAFSFFPTSVGFIFFPPLQTGFSMTPKIFELLIRSGAACEIWLLYFKQVHASSI